VGELKNWIWQISEMVLSNSSSRIMERWLLCKINGMDFKNDYIRLIMKNKKIQTISYMIELLLKKNGNI
jgi:hypothetical protein